MCNQTNIKQQRKKWRPHLWTIGYSTRWFISEAVLGIWTPVFLIRTVVGCGRGDEMPPVAPQDRSVGEGNLVSQSWARRLPFSSLLTNHMRHSRAGHVTSFSFRNQCPSQNCHLGEGPQCPQESYQSYWCQSGLQPKDAWTEEMGC